MSEKEMEFESKLIPIMREGVEVVKMIFFKELRDHCQKKPGTDDASFAGKLTGAVINDLFGTPNIAEPFAGFVRENREQIEGVLSEIPSAFEKMRIPLTDALRMQVLCDSMEGVEDQTVLERAAAFGILITERDLPLPHSFMELVRRLGSAHGLLIAPLPTDGEQD